MCGCGGNKAASGTPATSVIGYAYVASNNSVENLPGVGTISQYSIASTGQLTPLSPPTVYGGWAPIHSITVDPAGKYAYVAEGCGWSGGWIGTGAISLYSIAAGGALTRLSEDFVGGCYVTFDPSGRYCYVGNFSFDGLGAGLAQYVVNYDGTFTPMGNPTVAVIGDSGPMAIDTAGRYAYLVNSTQGTVSQYTIGATGELTPMSPDTVATGSGTTLTFPRSISVNPTGKYVYVANGGDNSASQYTISADGTLVPMSPATVSVGSGVSSITVDPTGKYLYAANENSAVSKYSINLNGTLTPMSPATIATGDGPLSTDPTGKYAYVTSSFDATVANTFVGAVLQYTIGPTGALTPLNPPKVTAGVGASYVVTTGIR